MIEKRDERVPRAIEFGFLALAVLAGAVQCWRYRHFMYPDGIQYVDVARQFTSTGFSGLLNGTWSPLYPLLLAAVWRLYSPSSYWLYASVQAVNLICFMLAAGAMVFFVRAAVAFRAARQQADGGPGLDVRALAISGYAAFMIVVAYMLNVRTMSPDMIVAAVVLTVSGQLLNIEHGSVSPKPWAAIGTVLAVGYLAKTVMFPVAWIYIGVAAVRQRRHLSGPVVAATAFALIAGPWLVALSFWAGHPTYGETGNLMYAWWVNGVRTHWIGEPPGTGAPTHPVKRIYATPDAYAFDRQALVTYQLFFDPTWWNAGIKPVPRIGDQMRALARTAGELKDIAAGGLVGIAVVFAGLLAASNPRRTIARVYRAAGVWLPAFAAIGLYMAVHIEGRLVAGQLLVLVTLLVASCELRSRTFQNAVSRAVACGFVIAAVAREGPTAAGAALNTWRDVQRGEARERWPDWEAADGLRAAGLAPGDRIAVIGNTLDLAWAQLAQLSIRAEITAEALPEFLATDPERQAQAIAALQAVPVRAVVARSADPVFDRAPWSRIGGTPFAIAFRRDQ